MTFRIGMKVACINNSAGGAAWHPGTQPALDAVYTVREIGRNDRGEPGLRLHEIELTGELAGGIWFTDNFYRASRFRPLVQLSTETGMEILRKVAKIAAKRRELTVVD